MPVSMLDFLLFKLLVKITQTNENLLYNVPCLMSLSLLNLLSWCIVLVNISPTWKMKFT